MADLDTVERAMRKSEEELLREWYDDLVEQVVGARSEDLLSATGDLREPFLGWLDKEGICDRVCREWNYCAKRSQFTDTTFLAAGIADLLLALGGIAAPINVATLLVKYYCDRICKCDEHPA